MPGWVWLAALCVPIITTETPSKYSYSVNTEYQNLIIGKASLSQPGALSTSPETFVYGGVFSLTTATGRINLEGFQQVLAMKCAVDQVNKIAAIHGPNTTFFYNIINAKSAVPAAMGATVNLIEAGIPVIIGPTDLDLAVAVAGLLETAELTLLNIKDIIQNLSETERNPNTFFRITPPIRSKTEALIDIALYFGWTLISALFSNTVLGLAGQREFLEGADRNGITVICETIVAVGETSGLDDTITCIANSQATVVLVWADSVDASDIIAKFYNSGSLPDITFLASDQWADSQDLEEFSGGAFPVSYLQGTIGVVPYRGDQSGFQRCISNIDPSSIDIPNFEKYYEKSLKCSLYDKLLPACRQSIATRSSLTSPQCQCTEKEELSSIRISSKVNYVYDSVFAVYLALYQLNNNCTAVSELLAFDFCNITQITTTQLQQVVSYVDFKSSIGTVGFGSRIEPNNRLEITQIRSDGNIEYVGQSISGKIFILTDLLQFKNGQTPVSAIIPKQVTFSDGAGIAALIFIIIALVIWLGVTVFFFVYRNEKVIRSTSHFFSQLMLLGILLCIVSQIFWDVTQTDFTCFTKVWLLVIGFGLIMGNFIVKTYRIFKIFSNAKVTSLLIRDIELLKFSGAIILLEIILLSVYSFTTGVPVPQVITSQSESLFTYIQCRVPSEGMELAGIIFLIGVNAVLVIAAAILAYLTRNVDSAFNESRYIAYTVYIYLLVGLILIPLYYTSGDTSSSVDIRFVLRNLAVLMGVFFTLGAVFGPKIYLVVKAKRDQGKLSKKNAKDPKVRRIFEVDIKAAREDDQQNKPYIRNHYTMEDGDFSRTLREITTTAKTATSTFDIRGSFSDETESSDDPESISDKTTRIEYKKYF